MALFFGVPYIMIERFGLKDLFRKILVRLKADLTERIKGADLFSLPSFWKHKGGGFIFTALELKGR